MVGGGGLAYLATYILTHLSISFLILSHSSPLAPIPFLRPMGGSNDSPKASRLVLIEWETTRMQRLQVVAFGGVSNSDRFRLRFRFTS